MTLCRLLLPEVEEDEELLLEVEEGEEEEEELELGGGVTATVEPVVTTTSADWLLGPCAMIACPVNDESTFSPIAKSPGR